MTAPAQGQPSDEAVRMAKDIVRVHVGKVFADIPSALVDAIALALQSLMDEAGRLREEIKVLLKTIMEQANFIVDQEHKLAAQSAENARLKRDLLASLPVKVQVLINEFFATMNNFDKPTEKDEEIKRLREALNKFGTHNKEVCMLRKWQLDAIGEYPNYPKPECTCGLDAALNSGGKEEGSNG